MGYGQHKFSSEDIIRELLTAIEHRLRQSDAFTRSLAYYGMEARWTCDLTLYGREIMYAEPPRTSSNGVLNVGHQSLRIPAQAETPISLETHAKIGERKRGGAGAGPLGPGETEGQRSLDRLNQLRRAAGLEVPPDVASTTGSQRG